MSDQNFTPASPEQPFGSQPAPQQAQPALVVENVAKGMFFALAAVVLGVLLTVVLWRAGFIAAITSYVLAAGAIFLYDKGAGTTPKRGLVPVLVLVVAGIVVAFFGVVASDAWDVYSKLGAGLPDTRIEFILNNIFRGEVLKSYGKDMAMFAIFAALGVYSTLRRLVASAR
jgi:hypothetical protein